MPSVVMPSVVTLSVVALLLRLEEEEKDRLAVSEDNLFLWVYGPLRNRFILPPLLNGFLNSLTKALA